MVPRDYQSRARDRIAEEWQKVRATLAVMATGLGKTYLATMIAEDRIDMGSTLFLCHRQELVWQTVNTFAKALGEAPEVEMGKYHAVLGRFNGKASPVIVSTVQTQYSGMAGKGRMSKFDPKKISTIVVDEAHHYVSPSFLRVVRYYTIGNPRAKVLGITATPDRRDKLAMGKLFDSVAIEYGIREGIDDGWLVPIDQYTGILTHMDLSNVGQVAGDLNPEQLAEVMEQKKNLFGMAEQVLARVGDRKTLIFASSVKHAELLAAILNDRAKSRVAEYVHAETPEAERADILKRFYARQFQFLCNVGICTEGFNDEGIEVVVCGRPTTSRALYTQMAGRGTRTLPGVVDQWDNADDRRVAIAESAKPNLELIDFVGNAGRHKLVTGVDILGGRYDEETIRRVKEAGEGRAVDITAELEAEWAAVQAERRAEAEIEAARLAQVRIDHQCLFEEVDPFSHARGTAGRGRKTITASRNDPATEAQKRWLASRAPRGTNLAELTIGQAGAMMSEIKRRSRLNLCSIGQAKVLRSKGLPDEVPRDTARVWMDRIARAGWSVPAEVRNEAALYAQTKEGR